MLVNGALMASVSLFLIIVWRITTHTFSIDEKRVLLYIIPILLVVGF